MSPLPPSRRAVLRTVGTTAVIGLAGCASLLGSGGVRLLQIRIESTDDQPHTVHTLVEFDGELVHWSATDIGAEIVGESDTSPASGGILLVERTWPDDPGRFVIRVRLDDRSSWRSLDSRDLDATCYNVKVDVTDWDRDDDPDVSLIPQVTDCDPDT